MERLPESAFLTCNEAQDDVASMEAARNGTLQNHFKSRQPGQRGPQKRPTKVLVTMRFSPQILAYFKASGDGWQTRMNDVLCAYVEQHSNKSS